MLTIAPWRAAIAMWPTPLRQRWADLTDRHIQAGESWIDAERESFLHIARDLVRYYHEHPEKPIPFCGLCGHCAHKFRIGMYDPIKICLECKPSIESDSSDFPDWDDCIVMDERFFSELAHAKWHNDSLKTCLSIVEENERKIAALKKQESEDKKNPLKLAARPKKQSKPKKDPDKPVKSKRTKHDSGTGSLFS